MFWEEKQKKKEILNKTKRQNNESKVRVRAARWRSRVVLSIRERAGSWESEREHSQLYCCLPVPGLSGVAWCAAWISTHPLCEALLHGPCVVTLLFNFLLGDGDWGGTALCRGSDLGLSWTAPLLSTRLVSSLVALTGPRFRPWSQPEGSTEPLSSLKTVPLSDKSVLAWSRVIWPKILYCDFNTCTTKKIKLTRKLEAFKYVPRIV